MIIRDNVSDSAIRDTLWLGIEKILAKSSEPWQKEFIIQK